MAFSKLHYEIAAVCMQTCIRAYTFCIVAITRKLSKRSPFFQTSTYINRDRDIDLSLSI